MIVVKLMGGLGNQMFQYATAKRLSLKNKSKLYLDLSWFEDIAPIDTPRHFELDSFKFEKNFIKPDQYVLAGPEKGLKITLYNITKGRVKPRVLEYLQKGHAFDPAVLSLKDNVCLRGWWQNEKYFKDARQTILKDFEFAENPSPRNQEILQKITRDLSVALHIRRGDYVSNAQTKKFHGVMGAGYYKTAVKQLEKLIGNQFTIFAFSDDPDWCKQNLRFRQPAVFVAHNQKGTEDLRLMKSCRHIITANSSFSWWGAWLNDDPQKIVIAPKEWFIDKEAGSNDIVPKSWLRI